MLIPRCALGKDIVAYDSIAVIDGIEIQLLDRVDVGRRHGCELSVSERDSLYIYVMDF